jgi:hypothetical protein
MIDHAKEFHARAKAEKENAVMAELEKHVVPMQWMVLVVVVMLCVAQLYDGWHYVADMTAQNEAMLQCINGKTLMLGDAMLRCEVSQVQLVVGVQP